MAVKKRFDFTKKDRHTQKLEKVGYLDFAGEEEEKRCSLYFYGDIVSSTWSAWSFEDKCPQDIADFLNQLEGYEDIDIYINSGGGDVFAGLAIYNQLRRYSGRKVGYVDGMAASIASVIMFACDELHFSTGAQAMIHKPLCITIGNADDHMESIKQLDMCENSILDVYEQHTKDGVTRESLKDLMAAETWFNGEELAAYFDIEVEERAAVAACSSDFFERYRNRPEKSAELNIQKVVDEVIAEMENRNIWVGPAKMENQNIWEGAAKQEILEDLYLYGV